MRPIKALRLPLAFAVALLAVGALPAVHTNARLLWSVWGAGAALLAWSGFLAYRASRQGRTFTLEVMLRNQHYVQACAHFTLFAYWGWYWQVVYQSAHLILAQLIFAYAFDALLVWSRRREYTLGFGPFPIIFSTNLFLWFRPDWFYMQFLMVALGFAGKELIRWNKDGRRVHIFNPSSLTLALFSIGLILTHQGDKTWGEYIAVTQNYPPHMYLLIFLVSLPGQYLFGVTLMTMSAVATVYLFGLLCLAITGVQFTMGPYIPIAVFLGMHLLFNDPSTSPRTELGRIIFGILYGLSAIGLHALLLRAGYPTFYDKLLQVPLLNLTIQLIDRAVRSKFVQRLDPTRLLAHLAPKRRNLLYMSAWVGFFVIMQVDMSQEQAIVRVNDQRTMALREARQQAVLRHTQELAQLDPDNRLVHRELGASLLAIGRPQEAIAPLRRAVELEPGNAETHRNLGLAMNQTGRFADAVYHYRQAIRLKPDWPEAMSRLARILATCPDRAQRDPDEALRLALEAVRLSGGRDPWILDVLAFAYAAAGRFDDAMRTAEAAEKIAADSAPQLAAQIRERLERHRELLPSQGSTDAKR